MKVLGLDTSSTQGSVALFESDRVIAEYCFDVRATHSERLLPAIEVVLKHADWKISEIELVACGSGPGSFTGLRIGLATALGIAFGCNIPVVSVPTLEAMAATFSYSSLRICPMLDAAKGQVFTALFDPDGHGGVDRICQDCSADPLAFAKGIDRPVLLIGEGVVKYRSILHDALGEWAYFSIPGLCYHRAGVIASFGLNRYKADPTKAGMTTYYVRKSDAEIETEKIVGG